MPRGQNRPKREEWKAALIEDRDDQRQRKMSRTPNPEIRKLFRRGSAGPPASLSASERRNGSADHP